MAGNIYAFGTPGQPVRMTMGGISEDEAALQVKEGEVSIKLDAFLSERSKINAAGDGIEQVDKTLDELKAEKYAVIKISRDNDLIVASTPYGTFDSDVTARANLNGQLAALDMMGDSAPDHVTWRLHDNSSAVLPTADFRLACLAVMQHISDTYAHGWDIEAQLAAADSEEELNAIEW